MNPVSSIHNYKSMGIAFSLPKSLNASLVKTNHGLYEIEMNIVIHLDIAANNPNSLNRFVI